MKITPEMLLFLAGKIGRQVEMRGPFVCKSFGGKKYEPHANKAQFAEVILWATCAGLNPDLDRGVVRTWSGITEHSCTEEHDNTDAGAMSATVIAVARALGWRE